MSEIGEPTNRTASPEPESALRSKVGLTAGKIGILLLTWSLVIQFGLPSSNPEISSMPTNESLVWRLLMNYNVTVIGRRGPIEPELLSFQKKPESESKAITKVYLVEDNSTSCEVSDIWKQHDFCSARTMYVLEGKCDDSMLYIEPNLWYAYAVLMILELYILKEFNLKDQLVLMGLMSVIHSIVMVAVAVNRAPDHTINLWVINN